MLECVSLFVYWFSCVIFVKCVNLCMCEFRSICMHLSIHCFYFLIYLLTVNTLIRVTNLKLKGAKESIRHFSLVLLPFLSPLVSSRNENPASIIGGEGRGRRMDGRKGLNEGTKDEKGDGKKRRRGEWNRGKE